MGSHSIEQTFAEMDTMPDRETLYAKIMGDIPESVTGPDLSWHRFEKFLLGSAGVGVVLYFVIGLLGIAMMPLAEDDPGWSCVTMGNRVCGTFEVHPEPTKR